MRRQDIALVQNYTKTTGTIGQAVYTTPDGAPKRVECNGYPLDAALIDLFGLQKVETRALWCDAWPGDLHSTIEFEGQKWMQAAPLATHNKSQNLLNVVVPIKLVS